jgi:UDPglucose--hexose-1-phosphate uridylyltransferase
MSELRWNPILSQWVAVASNRQDRPQMPKDYCPFDPGSGKVPDHYDVFLYPNDFAAFSPAEDPFDPSASAGLFGHTGARGACDVVLYHPDHNKLPSELSAEHWRLVIDLWTSRSEELWANPDIQYVYVFENTGVAIGVTMPHPHGQIYAFPFIPPYVERELAATSDYFTAHGKCLYCAVLAGELADGRRVVAQNDSFVAFVPYAARFPAEIQIYARRHVDRLAALTDAEKTGLSELLRIVRRKYDNLYKQPMPLMMVVRQPPVTGDHPYFHFHIEFYPIQRSATKLKYLAGVETGAGTFLNDTVAEERASALRQTEPVTPPL